MLKVHFKEATQNEIHLHDIQYDIALCFTKYLYTDDCEITEKNVFQLFQCCHQYQDKVLLRRCVVYIEQGITRENVCDIYQFAQQYHNDELIDKCLQYVSYRYEAIAATAGFTTLSTSDKMVLTNAKKAGVWIDNTPAPRSPGFALSRLYNEFIRKLN